MWLNKQQSKNHAEHYYQACIVPFSQKRQKTCGFLANFLAFTINDLLILSCLDYYRLSKSISFNGMIFVFLINLYPK